MSHFSCLCTLQLPGKHREGLLRGDCTTLVRNGPNPRASSSGGATGRPMGLAVGCPEGMHNTHMAKRSNHREGTVSTAER